MYNINFIFNSLFVVRFFNVNRIPHKIPNWPLPSETSRTDTAIGVSCEAEGRGGEVCRQ